KSPWNGPSMGFVPPFSMPVPYPAVPVNGFQSGDQYLPPLPSSPYTPPDMLNQNGLSDTGRASGRHQAQDGDKPVPVTDLLMDPITRKRYKIAASFDDELLRLSPWGKAKLGLQNIFVTIPGTIYQGLRGDGHFTFSDH